MLPLRPDTAAARRAFSFSVMSPRMSIAFSAPLGYSLVSIRGQDWGRGGKKTYAELNGDGEEVDTSLLGNLLTAGDTGKVDVAGLNEALGTSSSLQELLSESCMCVSNNPTSFSDDYAHL